VQLFRQHPTDYLSAFMDGSHGKGICRAFHGNLDKRINVATHRMRRFGPGLNCGLMGHAVPQGAFRKAPPGPETKWLSCRREYGVVPIHKDENKTTVGDLFGQAIMKYATFPMFTRRYLAHGVETCL